MSASEAKKIKVTPYTLIYWPGIPGRGEFIRLSFEYAAKEYDQILDVDTIVEYMREDGDSPGPKHVAPPLLKLPDGSIISQTAAILAYIAPELGLAGSSDIERAWINQLTLSALDLCTEAHDTHHPVAVELFYEDQKDEATRRAESFRDCRAPKFLSRFEATISNNKDGNGVLVGKSISTADLCLFQVISGIKFAFPKYVKKLEKSGKYAKVFALYDKIEGLPTIAEYLKSEKRLPFSSGIFRHYPELDSK